MSSPMSFTPSLSYFSRLTECPVWQAAFSPWSAQPEWLHPRLCATQVPASPPARLRAGCTPAQREGEGAAPSSPLRRSLFLQAPRTRALCLELIEVSRFQAGMSRERRLLNPLGRASRECPECGSSAHAASPPARLQGPPLRSPGHRAAIPTPPPPASREKPPYLLRGAAAAPARPAAAASTAAAPPRSLNRCSNKLPFPGFPFIHKGSHGQERQVETTFLLEEIGSFLRYD